MRESAEKSSEKVVRFRSSIGASKAGPKELASCDLLVERCRVSPRQAAKWLQQNALNRPVSRHHVRFLASEMISDRWILNGETIKISEDERILDGQHRLLACIEAGKSFESVVVYGLKSEAFTTVDQGKIRTGGDCLKLHFPEAPQTLASNTASASKAVMQIHAGVTTSTAKLRRSNAQILEWVAQHPDIWRCTEIVGSYPKSNRPMSVAIGSALLFVLADKDRDLASQYIRDLFTGEDINKTDPAYLIRQVIFSEERRRISIHGTVKIMMALKGWSALRNGRRPRSANAYRVQPDEKAAEIV